MGPLVFPLVIIPVGLWLCFRYRRSRTETGEPAQVFNSAPARKRVGAKPQATRLTEHQRDLLISLDRGAAITTGGKGRFDQRTIRTLVNRGLLSPDEAGGFQLTTTGKQALARERLRNLQPR